MKCRVDSCERDTRYKEKQLCQKHYFRLMRNGTTEKKQLKAIERRENAKGYQLIHAPDHPLAHSNGYVYEHRKNYYEKVGDALHGCEMCGKAISWSSCHIDHIDSDVRNNKLSNLRAVCRGCNVFRGHSMVSMGKEFFTAKGLTMSAFAWARRPEVKVSGATIKNRRLKGLNDYQCIFGEKQTHINAEPKNSGGRCDGIRAKVRQLKREASE